MAPLKNSRNKRHEQRRFICTSPPATPNSNGHLSHPLVASAGRVGASLEVVCATVVHVVNGGLIAELPVATRFITGRVLRLDSACCSIDSRRCSLITCSAVVSLRFPSWIVTFPLPLLGFFVFPGSYAETPQRDFRSRCPAGKDYTPAADTSQPFLIRLLQQSSNRTGRQYGALRVSQFLGERRQSPGDGENWRSEPI